MKEVVELIKVPLELLVLRKDNHPLDSSISISIEYCLEREIWLVWGLSVKRYNVFANFLIGTTIQDGGKKERSNVNIILTSNPKSKIRK